MLERILSSDSSAINSSVTGLVHDLERKVLISDEYKISEDIFG